MLNSSRIINQRGKQTNCFKATNISWPGLWNLLASYVVCLSVCLSSHVAQQVAGKHVERCSYKFSSLKLNRAQSAKQTTWNEKWEKRKKTGSWLQTVFNCSLKGTNNRLLMSHNRTTEPQHHFVSGSSMWSCCCFLNVESCHCAFRQWNLCHTFDICTKHKIKIIDCRIINSLEEFSEILLWYCKQYISRNIYVLIFNLEFWMFFFDEITNFFVFNLINFILSTVGFVFINLTKIFGIIESLFWWILCNYFSSQKNILIFF